MAIEDGYGLVGPQTPEVARALLDIADELDLPPDVIQTTATGNFVVPVDVAKKYEEALGANPELVEADTESGEPDETWRNAQIKAWAEAQGVDLGEATKKADMLAAIRATDKEE